MGTIVLDVSNFHWPLPIIWQVLELGMLSFSQRKVMKKLCQFCAKYQSYIIKVNPPSSPERTYAVRRIRDAFRENKNVKDPAEIQALVNKAKRDLGIIRRQGLTDVLHSLLKSNTTNVQFVFIKVQIF
ncbi:LYR motif-containing protein 4 isoform X2 [Canis aureus]